MQSPQTALAPRSLQTQQSANTCRAPRKGHSSRSPQCRRTAPPEPRALDDAGTGRTAAVVAAVAAHARRADSVAAVAAAPGRESVPVASPSQGSSINVPQVAPGFRAQEGPFPALERVGVNMGEQRALTVREAIELALANNKDIEVARENVRAAEFDLKAARGVYEPRFLTNLLRAHGDADRKLPFGKCDGRSNADRFFQHVIRAGADASFRRQLSSGLRQNRITTNNMFAALNPQYPSALTFSYTQPILKGRGFDQSRRAIEIAKKGLGLTDAQFRQRAIETITNVQRAYWDLVYALRNLQIQRDAVRDARAQLEHNRRLVSEGMLAPIDVVAAEAQISGFEQSVYSALDDVGRAENSLKNLIAEKREAAIWNVSIVPTDSVDLAPPAVGLNDAMQAALQVETGAPIIRRCSRDKRNRAALLA